MGCNEYSYSSLDTKCLAQCLACTECSVRIKGKKRRKRKRRRKERKERGFVRKALFIGATMQHRIEL